MELKELMRVAVTGEMEDITSFEAEAELFGADPRCGAKLSAFFLAAAEEKRGRLQELHRITKGGVGFRQRRNETARSVEAALRAHAARAERAAVVYTELAGALLKPEFREAAVEMALAEKRLLSGLRELQAALKTPGK